MSICVDIIYEKICYTNIVETSRILLIKFKDSFLVFGTMLLPGCWHHCYLFSVFTFFVSINVCVFCVKLFLISFSICICCNFLELPLVLAKFIYAMPRLCIYILEEKILKETIAAFCAYNTMGTRPNSLNTPSFVVLLCTFFSLWIFF